MGLANLVFNNNNDIFSTLSAEISEIDKINNGIIPMMHSTFIRNKVDYQVMTLLPNTLMILNAPFIQILKVENGMSVIRSFPSMLFQVVVKIFALINTETYESLRSFIFTLRDIFI